LAPDVALFFQAALVVATLAMSVMVPPPRGAMLVMPIGSASLAATVNWATGRGAMVMNAGRVPGSVVIFGERAALAWPAIRDGYVLIGVPASWCGDRGAGARQ